MKNSLYNLLRWSEKYAKTDMVYLAEGSFWTIVGQVVTFLFSFLLVWAFAHFLEPETYGIYKFVLSVVAILSIATLPGLRISIARSTARGQSGTLSVLTGTRLYFGLIGSIGACAISFYYFTQGNNDLSVIFLFASLFIPFMESFANYEPYLQGLRDFKTKSIYQIIQRASISLVTILLIVVSNDVFVVTVVYLSSFSILTALLYRCAIKKYPPNSKVDLEAKKYGIHLTIMSGLQAGATHLDKILLFHFVGPAVLAIYFFALAIPQEMKSLFGQINQIAFPKFSSRHDAATISGLWRKIVLFVFILTIPTLLYIAIAPQLFSLFFPAYMEAVFFSQVLSLLVLFTPVALIREFFTARGDTTALYITSFLEPAVFIVALLSLLPFFGVLGAITALFIKEAASACIYFMLLLRAQIYSQ